MVRLEMLRKGSSDSDSCPGGDGGEFTEALSLHHSVFQSLWDPVSPAGRGLLTHLARTVLPSARICLPFYFVLFPGFKKESADVTVKSFKSHWSG